MVSKLDRRLIQAIQDQREEQQLAAEKAIPPEPVRYPVTIELAQRLSPPPGVTRRERMAALREQVQIAQADLLETLDAMGVTQPESFALSNSIKADLTHDQIDAVQSRPDVKAVRLVKQDIVTSER